MVGLDCAIQSYLSAVAPTPIFCTCSKNSALQHTKSAGLVQIEEKTHSTKLKKFLPKSSLVPKSQVTEWLGTGFILKNMAFTYLNTLER